MGSESFSNGSTFSYEYDALNRLTIVKENGTIKLKYTYDAMGRLEREDNAYSNKSYKYEYTTNGNILSKKTYAYTTGTLGTVQSTETRAYGNSNWLDQLTNINGTAITYDNMGNPLKWHNASSLTWEGRKLKTFTKTDGTVISYTYDENGIRTGKKIGSENVEYVLSGTKIVQEKRANYTLTFLYDGSTLIGFNYKAGSTNADYYYGIDNFGNINYIYDNNGNIVTTYKYDAWGNILSTTGSLASTIGAINPYRYKSYYYDQEIQMYYLQSRYYDAGVQRFVSPDQIEYFNTTRRIYQCNFYTYCDNNPVNSDDPSGCLKWPGEIHRFVQIYVLEMFMEAYGLLVAMEYPIRYGFLRYKRADLYALRTGEVWEVKPDNPRYKTSGPIQLNDYINHIDGAKPGRDFGKIVVDYYTPEGIYKVQIRCDTGNGMIYYRYDGDIAKNLVYAGCIIAVVVGCSYGFGGSGSFACWDQKLGFIY